MLCLGNKPSDVLKCGLIFEVEAETLALKTSLINEDSGIGLEPSKCQHNMFINLKDLADSVWVLESSGCLLLHSEDNTILAFDSNSGRTSVHCFEGVLYLEEVAIGGEDGNSFIVCWHPCCF